MKNFHWLKLSDELFLNRKTRKIRSLPNGNVYGYIWIYLLVLASNLSKHGKLEFAKGVPYTAKMIAEESEFEEGDVERALCIFLEYGMLTKTKSCYKIKNWLKYQSSEQYEKIKKRNRENVKKFREKAKADAEAPECVKLDISEEEMKKLKLQINDDNIEHYLSVARKSVASGRVPKSVYEFIVKMATRDKRLKIDEKTGINQGIENEFERLHLPDEELGHVDLAFKKALRRSYGDDYI